MTEKGLFDLLALVGRTVQDLKLRDLATRIRNT